MAEPAKTRWLTLELGFFESQILLQTLRTIQKNYRINPAELDDETAGVWYSRRGCESAGMSEEEDALRAMSPRSRTLALAQFGLVGARDWEELQTMGEAAQIEERSGGDLAARSKGGKQWNDL